MGEAQLQMYALAVRKAKIYIQIYQEKPHYAKYKRNIPFI